MQSRSNTPETLLQQVNDTLEKHHMLAQGETILAAVSGGADSIGLLHALLQLGHTVQIAHFDHVTRHGVSADDADFVRDVAQRLSIPFHLERQDINARRNASSQSFEVVARDLRYDFLLRTAQQCQCAAIATGHHQDDVAETILMRILRGTSPKGLAGIPPVRQQDNIRIIRPLLNCTRDTIQAWLRNQDIPWREDATNQDTQHVRNRIRNQLIPTLTQEYNPQLTAALARLAEANHTDNDFLDAQAEEAFKRCYHPEHGINRQEFATLHQALQRRCILRLAWQLGLDLPYDRILRALHFIHQANTGKYFDLGETLTLYQGRTHTCTLTPSEHTKHQDPVTFEVPGDTDALGWHFEARLLEEPPSVQLAEYCGPKRQVFDADRLGTTLAVRHRRPGDTFHPFGMNGTRKLKDYFIDLGIPAPDRDAQPLIIAGEKIVWIVGKASSAETAITPATRHILEITVAPCS